MAMVPEAGLLIEGSILNVHVDRGSDGNDYATVQVSNEDGISNVNFNAQDTRNLQVHAFQPTTRVAWVVRPYVVYGVSKNTGNAYGILKLNYVRNNNAE